MKISKILYLFIFTLLVACNKNDSSDVVVSVTDVDGNTYETVTLGNLTWTTSNFQSTKLNDGTAIERYDYAPNDDEDWWWNSRTKAMYAVPDVSDLNNLYDDELPEDHFGYHYSHGALQSGKLAPEGWRIATKADYEQLFEYVKANGHADDPVKVLKSVEGWGAEYNGTNAFGLDIMPNGYCTASGNVTGAQAIGTLVSTDVDGDQHYVLSFSDDPEALAVFEDARFGAGIRLIKE